MPAKSIAQRQLMAIAEHHPSEVSAKNKGVLKMSKGQLHDFAATKQTGMHEHVAHTHGHPGTPERVQHVHQHLQTPKIEPHKGVTVHGEPHAGPVAGSLARHRVHPGLIVHHADGRSKH
jgi:hypothetical protein